MFRVYRQSRVMFQRAIQRVLADRFGSCNMDLTKSNLWSV